MWPWFILLFRPEEYDLLFWPIGEDPVEICLVVSDGVNGLPGLGVLERNCAVLSCGGMVALPLCPGCAGLDKRADALVVWTGAVDTSSEGEIRAKAYEAVRWPGVSRCNVGCCQMSTLCRDHLVVCTPHLEA